MIVGIVEIGLHIPQAGSLKEKRAVLSSLKKRIRNKFNVSIAEVEYQEKWQRATLGLSIVADNKPQVDSVVQKLELFILQEFRVTITFWDVRFA